MDVTDPTAPLDDLHSDCLTARTLIRADHLARMVAIESWEPRPCPPRSVWPPRTTRTPTEVTIESLNRTRPWFRTGTRR